MRHVHFVERGLFRKFYVDYKGNEINTRFAKPNDFMVDFVSFITKSQSQYHWRAVQDSSVIALDHEAVEQLYDQSLNWQKFGRLIAESSYIQVMQREEMLHFQKPRSVTRPLCRNNLTFST